MPYKAFFQYASGAKSHSLTTDSSREAKAHLDYLLSESEPRSLAAQIVILHGKEIILEARTSDDDDTIRGAARFRRVGVPQSMLEPVTASIYMPQAAKDFLLELGQGSLAAGMRNLLLATGEKALAVAYMQESDNAEIA